MSDSREKNPDLAPVASNGSGGDSEFSEGISLLAVANVLLRYRRLVLGLPIVAFVTAYLLTPPVTDYIARARLLVPGTRAATSLGGIAQQFGVFASDMRGTDQGPQFFAWLISSKDLLRRVAESEFRVAVDGPGGDTVRAPLAEIYRRAGILAEARVDEAANRLAEKDVNASVDKETGFFHLDTYAPWPELAVQLNQRVLELVKEIDSSRRQEKAAAERQFLEKQVGDAWTEVKDAEDDHTRFLERNRIAFHRGSGGLVDKARFNSPELDAENARLQRRIKLKEGVYLSLAQAYEQARLEEAREATVITVLEKPENSVRLANDTDRRTPMANGLIALVAALVFAIGLAFLREYLATQPTRDPAGYAEFRKLSRAAVGDIVPSVVVRRFRVTTNGGRGQGSREEVVVLSGDDPPSSS